MGAAVGGAVEPVWSGGDDEAVGRVDGEGAGETCLAVMGFVCACSPRCTEGTIQVRPASARATNDIAISPTARRFLALSGPAESGAIA
ncbi:MAG TPA: hypothetical protein VIO37_00635 [Candidatus Dormibacteraeota bacterium]|jgi:hypothetical protein